MNKSLKTLIALGSVLIVLGGVTGIWLLNSKDDTDEISSSSIIEVEGAGIELIKKDPDTINKIEVSNTLGDFNVLRKYEASETSSAVFTIEGYENLLLEESIVWTLANNMSDLKSNSIVAENCTEDDLEQYGLKTPEVTAILHDDSGESIKFYVGKISPNSENTYFRLDGDDTVYTVETGRVANYKKEKDSFISLIVLEEPPEELYPIINKVTIERGNLDYDIVLEYDTRSDTEGYKGGTTATHVLTEPLFSYIAIERSVKVTNGIFGLTASEFYSIYPSEKDIAETGLNEPFCTLTVECDGGTSYKLNMSEPFVGDDGAKYHYAMLDGVDIIYIISTENAVWGTVEIIDFTSRIVFGSNVWNIEKLVVTGKDVEPITFIGEGSTKDDYYVMRDNAEFDREHFRLFYSFLISTPGESLAIDEKVPDTEPVASISITDRYEKDTYTVSFYDNTALTSLIVIDGECRFTCSKSFVNTLLENIKRIDTGEDYITTWG